MSILNKNRQGIFALLYTPDDDYHTVYGYMLRVSFFPNLGRDDTCLIYTRLLFSAGNLLSSETSIIRLYGTPFLFTQSSCYLKDYQFP